MKEISEVARGYFCFRNSVFKVRSQNSNTTLIYRKTRVHTPPFNKQSNFYRNHARDPHQSELV